MKIILIAQAYPPYPVVGALRARKIARAFRDAGHEVTVITERLEPDAERLRPAEPGITVCAVTVGPKLRERAVSLLRRIRPRARAVRAMTAGAPDLGVASALPSADSTTAKGSWLRRFVLALLWLPDDEQRFVRPALRAARPIIDEVGLVYSTAPSWSSHVVGLLLRRRHRVRWVADFRDPWLDLLAHQSEHPRTGPTDWMLRWIERAILREADHIVTVAAKTRDALAAKLPAAQRHKVLLARNGVDVTVPARLARQPGPFRIAYAGSFYDDRDPRLFLTALARLRIERGLTRGDLRVDLVGTCRTLGEISIERFVRELGLDDLVHFRDWMPQPDAWRLLSSADLLLMLARGMRLQVPNKLYEYLGLRIPIFAWADPEGESAEVLGALLGHFVVTGDTVDEMASSLRAALDGAQPAVNSPPQERLLEEWSVRYQMDHLVTAVGG